MRPLNNQFAGVPPITNQAYESYDGDEGGGKRAKIIVEEDFSELTGDPVFEERFRGDDESISEVTPVREQKLTFK